MAARTMMDILRVVARFPYSAVELDELSIQEGDHLQLLQVRAPALVNLQKTNRH